MDHNKWNVFNFILSENINLNINEQLFESKVIQAFGELGWKEYLNNIEIRPTLHIGSVNRIEPDLLFKSDKGSNLFVVEVKRPGIDLNQDHQKQLFSYMRQLKLEYGILIGKEIQVYYDGNLSYKEFPILLEKISFKKENKKGFRFVELFNKTDFSFDNLNNYTQNILNEMNSLKQSKILKQTVLSEDFEVVIKSLIKEKFTNEYDPNTINLVLDKISISVIDKEYKSAPKSNITPVFNSKHNNPAPTDKRTKDGLKIGEFVQLTFRRLFNDRKLTPLDISKLLTEDYSKSVFLQPHKILRYTSEGTKDSLGNNRYYTREIFGEKYYLTSQWVEKHWDPFLNWLKM